MRIVDLFESFFIDLDGVVYIGDKPISGAKDTLLKLRKLGKTLLYLTNDPRGSPEDYVKKLEYMGIPSNPEDIITSIMAIAYHMRSQHQDLNKKKAYVVGTQALKDEINRIGLTLVEGDKAKFADFVIIGGHPGFHYEEIKISTLAIRNGAYFYATNRDPIVPSPEGYVPGTGSELAAIEVASGKRATTAGKPETIMFEVAISKNHLHPKEKIAIIGDRLDTDIKGGKAAGISTILVLSGSTKSEELIDSDAVPDFVINNLRELLSDKESVYKS